MKSRSLNYTGITREMINEALVGKLVFEGAKWRDEDQLPRIGKVVSGNSTSGYIWVTFGHNEDPVRLGHVGLMMIVDDRSTTKQLKYSGKTIESLENFCRSVRAEGGDGKTELNPHKIMEHVSFVVTLPVATGNEPDKTLLMADDKVIDERPTF